MITKLPIAATITPRPDWLAVPSLQRVLQLLGADKTCVVGGAVRNTISGLPVGDIDIATELTPDLVTSILESKGIKVVPTGLAHGTVTAVLDGHSYEITTLRKDVETDGRHAVVAFTQDWVIDAQRRDFTMNALYMDALGNVFDPTGLGLNDAKVGHVRFVGNATERIKEDALRILRFFRFHAFYGIGALDSVGLDACKNQSKNINNLSLERVTEEFLKILSAPSAATIIQLMSENKIMLQYIDKYKNLSDIISAQSAPISLEDIAARLWYVTSGKVGGLKLNNKMKKTIQIYDKYNFNYFDLMDKTHKFSSLLFVYGTDLTRAILSLMNDRVGRDKCMATPIPVFPISAKDVPLPEGEELGKILKSLRMWWIENGCEPNREACLRQMKFLLND